MYLKYVNFGKLDDKALAELEVLKLADGSTTKCATGVGEKGIPTAFLPRSSSEEQIDLLPVSWLVSRGCSCVWRDQLVFTTP